MPIYEYGCKKCGAVQEEMHKIDDTPKVECEACGAKGMKKMVSAAGFRLKGGGWYETDFKSTGQKNLVSSDDKTPAAPAASADAAPKEAASAKTEAKPAAKKENKTEKKKATKESK